MQLTDLCVWQGFPVLICGVSCPIGNLFCPLVVLSSHEDSEAWSMIYKFMHGLGYHFQFRMGDGAKEITKAGIQVSICLLFFESNNCYNIINRKSNMKVIQNY